jgi:hypothetical protein
MLPTRRPRRHDQNLRMTGKEYFPGGSWYPKFDQSGAPTQGLRFRGHEFDLAGRDRRRAADFPVLCELRADLVSFLPPLRQYSGNWVTSMWAFAPDAEPKLDESVVVKPGAKEQLSAMFDSHTADVFLHQFLAFRALRSQGRRRGALRDRPDTRERPVAGGRPGRRLAGTRRRRAAAA